MKAKRSLGQNFLTSGAAIKAIVDAAGVSETDTVLEIGPGKGALTKEILARGARVIAIEKDDDLYKALQQTFAAELIEGKLGLVHGDALEQDVAAFGVSSGGYKIVANIPFNITGALTRYYLSNTVQPQTMALIVQKEVAERIASRDGKESILSMSVQAYGTPRYIKTIKAGSFTPKPKVDSAIILIEDISRTRFKSNEQEDYFFQLVKAGFAQKRKKLSGNLKTILPQAKIAPAFDQCNLDSDIRAEKVTIDKWMCLSTCATQQ